MFTLYFNCSQIEEVKLHPGGLKDNHAYSNEYTSISGLKFKSDGSTLPLFSGSARYHSLSLMFDGHLKNAYIVQSSFVNVVIEATLPRLMFIHQIRLYPVCSKDFSVQYDP